MAQVKNRIRVGKPNAKERGELKGGTLLAVRVAWWLVAGFAIVAYAITLSNAIQQTVTAESLLPFVGESYVSTIESGIAQLGLTPQQFFLLFLVPEFAATLTFLAIGLLIRTRRPNDWFSLFASLWMIMFGLTTTSTFVLLGSPGGLLEFFYSVAVLFSYIGIVIFLFVFPDGKFWPSWTRYIALGWSLFSISTVYSNWFDWESPLSGLIVVPLLGAILYSQIYRYRKVSTPAQREQTKWLIVALALNVLLVIGTSIAQYAASESSAGDNVAFYLLIANAFEFLGNLLLVLSVGIAILRYRLWDIDVVVNRTLIYGPLSLILAAIFAVSVALINQSTRQLFGTEATTTAAVVSAVIVALFFQPVRARIEKWINKRVYPENNLARELVELSPDIRNLLSLQEIARIVAQRVTRVLNSREGAVYLATGGNSYTLAAASQARPSSASRLKPTAKMQADLSAGRVVSSDKIHLLVPLFVPRLRSKELVGLLTISERKDGRGYSSDDRRALVDLGGEVGTAIYAGQLRMKNKGA